MTPISITFNITHPASFSWNTCEPGYFCNYPINQSCGSSSVCEITRIQDMHVKSFWNWRTCDLGDCDHGVVVGLSIIGNCQSLCRLMMGYRNLTKIWPFFILVNQCMHVRLHQMLAHTKASQKTSLTN